MADIRDYLEAARATDMSLEMLREYGNRVEAGEESAVALALLLVGEAVVSAIREAATRADYIARDLA